MKELSQKIEDYIEKFYEKYKDIDDYISTINLSEDKWSLKEIIGHLIDSAANNHHRFIRLQLSDNINFPDYNKDEWLSIEKHNKLKFSDLLSMFLYYNRLLKGIILNVNTECLQNKWIINSSKNNSINLLELINHYISHLIGHIEHFEQRFDEIYQKIENKTEITINSYNKSAINFEKQFMDLKLYKKSFEYLITFIKPNMKILDLGCGPGNVAKFMSDIDKTLSIHCVDLSEDMIKLASKNVPNAIFYHSDIRNINFNSDEFDLIIAAFCLPFLNDIEAKDLVKKTALYLKKGGVLYLSTMEGNGYGFEKPDFSQENEMYFNYYDEKFLFELFQNNNLKIEKYIKQDYHKRDGFIMKDMIFILKKI